MPHFDTTSVTVAYRQRCEDREKVVELVDGVVIAVADGGGGAGAGAKAETEIREVTASASLECDPLRGVRSCARSVDYQIGNGKSTCIVVARSARGIVGTSVGESMSWLLEEGEVNSASRVLRPTSFRRYLKGRSRALMREWCNKGIARGA